MIELPNFLNVGFVGKKYMRKKRGGGGFEREAVCYLSN